MRLTIHDLMSTLQHSTDTKELYNVEMELKSRLREGTIKQDVYEICSKQLDKQRLKATLQV